MASPPAAVWRPSTACSRGSRWVIRSATGTAPETISVQGLPVVVGAGAVGADDAHLAVVDDVGVAGDGGRVPGQAAEEADRPPAGGHPQGGLLGRAGGGGDDDDVGPAPAGQLEDRLHRVAGVGPDGLVGRDQAGGQLQAPPAQLDQEHPGRAAGPGQPDVQATDRPGADHHHGLALADPGVLLAVDDAAQRLGQRRLGERQPLGDAVDAADGQRLGRDAHELGEAAVVLVADRLLVGADRHPAAPALVAGAVGDGRDDLHPVAHRPAAGALADLDHLAGDLVAEHPGRAQVGVAGAPDLGVGPADRAVADPDQQVAGAGRGLGGVLDPDVPRRVEAQHPHPSGSLRCWTVRPGKPYDMRGRRPVATERGASTSPGVLAARHGGTVWLRMPR